MTSQISSFDLFLTKYNVALCLPEAKCSMGFYTIKYFFLIAKKSFNKN